MKNLLADNVATVLTARFAGLLSGWNGKVGKKFQAETHVLNGLCNRAVCLQREAHQARRQSLEAVRAVLAPQNSEGVTVGNAG